MAAQTKNYMDGPDKWVINGTLAVGENATVTGLAANPLTPATADTLGGVKVGEGLAIEDGVLSVEAPLSPAANQADCEAEDVAGVVTAFNALLAKLKAAGLMEADE